MRIGELAARSGVTVRTVRYYVEEGLLPDPPLRGRYGDFDETYLLRLQLIRRLKEERLTLPAIRQRLLEVGVIAGPVSEEAGAEDGLFRSRFAQEAGLRAEQVAQLEAMGLLESHEGLLPVADLPLAQAVADLLARGATLEDVAMITAAARQEAQLHRRLLDLGRTGNALAQALQWQEQVRAVAVLRDGLLSRWIRSGKEER